MVEINNATRQKVDFRALERVAQDFLSSRKKGSWSLSIALVGDRRMRAINRDFRGNDAATDVLSFAGDLKQKYFGEIVISLDQACRVSKYRQVLPESDLRPGYILPFLLVHGLLHLDGKQDDTEPGRLEMISLGRKFLAGKGGKWYNSKRK